ncbi:MAG: ATP synthase F1 subunit gamma, partial [Acidobacteria bacterium]|nr:ATP synthase F1 subunit gamma [Acidobacteriota bacterium]
MPSLIDIRRRVRAVKSTQQITKAMKMVSSSKLRRAQERILRSRPYAQEMLRVFNNLASRTDQTRHALLQEKPGGRTLLIVVTADRGLAGSFNANVIKGAAEFIATQPRDPGREIALALVGRKGRDFFMRRGFDVRYEEVGLFQSVKWSHAQTIANTAIKEFLEGDVGNVYLVYNEFRSVMVQRVVVERLLPIANLAMTPQNPQSATDAAGAGDGGRPVGTEVDYLFEPSPEELLGTFLPFHVAVQINRALLESSAAEHAAR